MVEAGSAAGFCPSMLKTGCAEAVGGSLVVDFGANRLLEVACSAAGLKADNPAKTFWLVAVGSLTGGLGVNRLLCGACSVDGLGAKTLGVA